MASLDLKVDHLLTLTPVEFRLITKALRGTLDGEGDKAAALLLAEEIHLAKEARTKNWIEGVAKNADNVRKARVERGNQ